MCAVSYSFTLESKISKIVHLQLSTHHSKPWKHSASLFIMNHQYCAFIQYKPGTVNRKSNMMTSGLSEKICICIPKFKLIRIITLIRHGIASSLECWQPTRISWWLWCSTWGCWFPFRISVSLWWTCIVGDGYKYRRGSHMNINSEMGVDIG